VLGLLWGAIASRRGQGVAVFGVTLLAVVAAAAAATYSRLSAEAVAGADAAAAPARQRLVSVTGRLTLDGGARSTVDEFTTRVDEALAVPGVPPTASLLVRGVAASPEAVGDGVALVAPLLYRDDFCDHATIDGECPDSPGEVLLSTELAGLLGARVGDDIGYHLALEPNTEPLRVVGLYRVADPFDPYWLSGSTAVPADSGVPGVPSRPEDEYDAIVTELETVGGFDPDDAVAVADLVLPVGLFTGTSGYDVPAGLARADHTLSLAQLDLTSDAAAVADLVARDRRTLELSVAVAAAELLALCWFALFLAIRHTAQERRVDNALLGLRGSTRTRALALIAGQSAVPMLLAAAVGAPIGLVLGPVLAGRTGGSAPGGTTVADAGTARLVGIAVGAAVLGALVVALLAEAQTLRSPVVDLLRRVPPRTAGWQGDLADLAAVLVAAVGIVQVQVAGGDPGVLGLAVPGLFALAVGVACAVALRPLAAKVATAALRTGRLAPGLAAAYLSRRRGTHRLVALGVIAVALLGTALLSWGEAASAGGQQAQLTVGADRVLTVRATSRAHLLAAVRAADPDGRQAMAVVVNARDRGPRAPVVAVDTARLAAIVPWRSDYGPVADLVAWLRPAAPEPLRVTGTMLRLTATADGVTGVRVQLRSDVDGRETTVQFGPMAAGRAGYDATAGCAGGCRLVAVEPVGPPGGTITLHELRAVSAMGAWTICRRDPCGAGAGGIGPTTFGDAARWRGPVGRNTIGSVLSHARLDEQGLRLRLSDPEAGGTAVHDARAYPVDAAVPVPIAVAGALPRPRQLGDQRVRLFGGAAVPVVVRPVPVLPRAGTDGVLVDLEYADRVVPDAGTGDVFQVWLAPGADRAVIDRLAASGVTMTAEDSVAGAEARIARQAPATASRFGLLAAAFAVLLAAGAVGVLSAVERGPRRAELAGLRAQGLSARAVRRVARLGTLAVVAVGLVVGVAAAAIAWQWLR